MTLPFSVIQAKHLNHPFPFPSVLDLPHSQQEDLWILSPKLILNPLPSLHLRWQTASTAVRPPNVLPGLLQQPPDPLPTSLLAPSPSSIHSAYCCQNTTNQTISLPCLIISVASQISSCGMHDLVPAGSSNFISCHCPPTYCALMTLVMFYCLLTYHAFLSQGLGSFPSEWLTSFLLLIGS